MNTNRGTRFLALLLIIAAALLSLSGARGQGTLGTVSGVVKDATGGVLPGVTLKARHLETGIARTTISDDAGRYQLPQLALGEYEFEAELVGFQTSVRKGITLTVGRELEVNFILQVGEITERVEVSAEAPLVETTSSTLSGLVDERAIRDLPLNGRSFTQLIGLHSGTYNPGTASFAPEAAFSVSGGRVGSNRFLIEGTEVPGRTNGGQEYAGSIAGSSLGVEAIREFTVLTNAYSAEHGKRPGGVVNVAMRSGTNELHGSVFEFHRNDNLDARNFFDSGGLPEFKKNNFGFALGGPIVRDRTFFFGNYEGVRQNLGLTNIAVVPDEQAHRGLLPGPGGVRQIQIADSVKPYLALYPLPNGRNNGDGTAEFLSNPASTLDENFYLVKVDDRFSEADSIFVTYGLQNTQRFNPSLEPSIPIFVNFRRGRIQYATIQETRTFSPRLLNTLRLGYSRNTIGGSTDSLISIDPKLSFVEGQPFGIIRIGGGVGGGLLSILQGDLPTKESLNFFQFSDQLAYIMGRHSLKAGVEIQRNHMNVRDSEVRVLGQYTFPSLERFLLGVPSDFQAARGDSTKGLRQWFAAFYFQDDLKLRPNLTLNLGLRYEFVTVLKEAHGKLSNFHKRTVDGFKVLENRPTLGDPFMNNNSLTGFTPRIGFAWDVFGDGKTSLRSGFGAYYDQFTQIGGYTFGNTPFLNRLSIDSPVFPKLDLSNIAALTPSPDGIDTNLQVPTILQYNLTMQREIFPHTTLSLGYAGSHGYRLLGNRQSNAAIPQIQADGGKFFPAGLRRRNPGLGAGRFIESLATSDYNSVQLSVERSYSQGLRLKGAYTFAKSLDDRSSLSTVSGTNNPANQQDPDDVGTEHGLSAFDTRHNFVFNYTYDLPFGRGGGGLGVLISGWQINGIAAVNSGPPFTARLGFNRSRNLDTQNPDRPNLRAGASNNRVLGGPDQYFDVTAFELQPAGFFGNAGRNTVSGPGLVNSDFALVKNTAFRRVSEDLALQFKVEFFNVLNRANFAPPDGIVLNSNGTPRTAGARIRSTVTTSRQIQLGLKIVF